MHGDVVHSRPVAINFSDDDNDPKIVVFYGGNDGVLRAINGNRSEDIGSAKPGDEIWGFIPPEFFGHVKRLRDNAVPITIKATADVGDDVDDQYREPKPYGFDGVISAYIDPDSTKRWIYATMRRGGRMVYAFDVSGIATNADSPRLLWRYGCPGAGDAGCVGLGSSGMGQTWSAPKVFKTDGYPQGDNVAKKPMVIMGGGYDPCEDQDPHNCTAAAKGRTVVVLDAETGQRIWDFVTERPVVADVFIVPDKAGKALYAYVVDMGGNVYRISGGTDDEPKPFGKLQPQAWVFKKIASLGCDTGGAECAPNRKFMYMPDVVQDGDGYVLLVGSGDREKPLKDYQSAYSVENYFFMLRDFPELPDWLEEEVGNCNGEFLCLKSLLKIDGPDNPEPADLASKKGWYLALNEGEQVVTSAITVYGATTFSTHTPTDPPEGACDSDLGLARVYNIKYSNAAPSKVGMDRSQEIDGGGLPPSPVAGRVTLDTGEEVSFIIGASSTSPIDGSEPIPPDLSTLPKSITYWFIER